MSTSTPADSASLPLRQAMERGDVDAALHEFRSDAVVRSPFTDSLAFEGHAQIRAIVAVVLDVLDDLRYSDEIHAGERAVLVARASVAGQELELVDHLLLDDAGKVREMTVFFRPLTASAVALRLIGAGLAGRRSPRRARLITVLARPLALLIAASDRIGPRIIGPPA